MINDFDLDLQAIQLYDQPFSLVESFHSDKSQHDLDNLSRRWHVSYQSIQKKIKKPNRVCLQKVDEHVKNVALFKGTPSQNNLEHMELDKSLFPYVSTKDVDT